eukprot:Colp12_sorted_trinity150504_noHs@3231
MSYRDLRNFTEAMRALGFPRLISMENFRNPNFPLVAEILMWLIKRYDPNADVQLDIEYEQDRVIFIKTAAHFMLTKAMIKLNPKKLYQADGYAVKELLKVATVLYSAMKATTTEQSENTTKATSFASLDAKKLEEVRQARALASEITAKGASLYDLLGKEIELRDARIAALARPLDLDEYRKAVEKEITNIKDQCEQIMAKKAELETDRPNLISKIEKKRQELERNENRLRTLETVRPAFMDEFDKLQEELSKQYETYMLKFRNLTYLEHQLEEYRRAEQASFEQTASHLKEMRNKLNEEELEQMRGDNILKDTNLDELDIRRDSGTTGQGAGRVYGTMDAGDEESSEEADDGSAQSGDDDEEGGSDEDLIDDDDDDVDGELYDDGDDDDEQSENDDF